MIRVLAAILLVIPTAAIAATGHICAYVIDLKPYSSVGFSLAELGYNNYVIVDTGN